MRIGEVRLSFSDTELAEDLSQQVFGVKLADNFAHCVEGSAQLDRDKLRRFAILQASAARLPGAVSRSGDKPDVAH